MSSHGPGGSLPGGSPADGSFRRRATGARTGESHRRDDHGVPVRAPGRIGSWQLAVLGVAWLLFLVPVWAFQHFPSQDGPMHLHNAGNLLQLLGSSETILNRYYIVSPSAEPTWLVQLMLAGLLLVVPPLVAEKLLLTLYVAALPLSLWYAARPSGRAPVLALALSFPFIFSYPLYMGFYNFTLSLPLLFFTLGYWLRTQATGRSLIPPFLVAALVALYFAHPLTLVVFLFTAVAASFWFFALVRDGNPVGRHVKVAVESTAPGFRGVGKRMALLLGAALPALLLVGSYLTAGVPGELNFLSDFAFKASELLQLTSILALREGELALSRMLALLLTVLSTTALIGKLRSALVSTWDGFLLAAVLLSVAYMAVPTPSDVFVHERLNLLIWLLLVLWLGGQRLPRVAVATGSVVAVALALGFLAVRLPAHERLDAVLREYTSAEELVRPNSTLAAISVGDWGEDEWRDLEATEAYEWRVDPFLHASAYLTFEKPVVLLTNYQARTDYFPIRYRVDRLRVSAPTLDTARVDLALVWGAEENPDVPGWADVLSVLHSRYRKVFTSTGGRLEAYRPKP